MDKENVFDLENFNDINELAFKSTKFIRNNKLFTKMMKDRSIFGIYLMKLMISDIVTKIIRSIQDFLLWRDILSVNTKVHIIKYMYLQTNIYAVLSPMVKRMKLEFKWLTRYFIKWIITDQQAFSLVENNDFQLLINMLNPRFQLSSRQFISESIIKLYTL